MVTENTFQAGNNDILETGQSLEARKERRMGQPRQIKDQAFGMPDFGVVKGQGFSRFASILGNDIACNKASLP